jgi:hypothetical protein
MILVAALDRRERGDVGMKTTVPALSSSVVNSPSRASAAGAGTTVGQRQVGETEKASKVHNPQPKTKIKSLPRDRAD